MAIQYSVAALRHTLPIPEQSLPALIYITYVRYIYNIHTLYIEPITLAQMAWYDTWHDIYHSPSCYTYTRWHSLTIPEQSLPALIYIRYIRYIYNIRTLYI